MICKKRCYSMFRELRMAGLFTLVQKNEVEGFTLTNP